jgi:hypothetical protein
MWRFLLVIRFPLTLFHPLVIKPPLIYWRQEVLLDFKDDTEEHSDNGDSELAEVTHPEGRAAMFSHSTPPASTHSLPLFNERMKQPYAKNKNSSIGDVELGAEQVSYGNGMIAYFKNSRVNRRWSYDDHSRLRGAHVCRDTDNLSSDHLSHGLEQTDTSKESIGTLVFYFLRDLAEEKEADEEVPIADVKSAIEWLRLAKRYKANSRAGLITGSQKMKERKLLMQKFYCLAFGLDWWLEKVRDAAKARPKQARGSDTAAGVGRPSDAATIEEEMPTST